MATVAKWPAPNIATLCLVLHQVPYDEKLRLLCEIYEALKPGGRFVAEFGGDGNIAEVRAAIATVFERRDIDAAKLMPWFFPT